MKKRQQDKTPISNFEKRGGGDCWQQVQPAEEASKDCRGSAKLYATRRAWYASQYNYNTYHDYNWERIAKGNGRQKK